MKKELLSSFVNSEKVNWYFAFVAAVLFLGMNGYFFNYGDQEEHLSLVYKMFDPALYPNDYFMVPNEQTFSVRFYYKWLVYGVSLLMGVEAACFLLTVTAITVSAWAVGKITLFFDDSKLSAFISPVLLLLGCNQLCVGDNSFQDNELICSTLSIMFCALGFLYYFKERYLTMAVLLGLGGLFQILAALLLCGLLCALMVLHKKVSLKKAISCFIVFIVVASPMLGPIIYRQFIFTDHFDKNAYYIALYHIRNPNHYLPSYFPFMDYVKFFALMGIAFFFMYLSKIKDRKFFYIFTALVLLGMLGYYVLLEKLNVLAIGKTQWFKVTIWLTMCYAILIAIGIRKSLSKIVSESKLLRLALLFSLPILAFISFNILFSKFSPIAFFKDKYRIGYYEKGDLQKMHEWIALHTPKDAVFHTSPGNFSFLCDAKRSLLIGHKSVIHEPYFLVPWAVNFQRIFNFKYDTLTNMSPLEAAKEGFNRQLYIPLEHEKLDFRLDDISTCKFVEQLGEEIHREGNYTLTRVKR